MKPRNLLLLCLLGHASTAVAESRTVLRAEMDYYGEKIQQGLVYSDDEVLLSRNTNHFCGGENPARVGTFVASYDARLKANAAVVEQISLRAAKIGKDRLSGGSHELRLYVGPVELTRDPTYGRVVERLVREACDYKIWEPVKAAEISFKPATGAKNSKPSLVVRELKGKRVLSTYELGPEKSGCQHEGKRWRCTVAEWGTLFFDRD